MHEPSRTGKRERLVGSTGFVTLGARFAVARHVAVRGELRVRSDDPAFNYLGIAGERWLGLSVRW